MCGIISYEFSEILSRFGIPLDTRKSIFDANKILRELKKHTKLYKLSLDLQDAMTCFFVVCSQMTAMFCSLCVFVLMKKEDITTPQIIEFVFIILLMPPIVS
ncbi:hypothetical protein AVEN_171824-1 [Araneus ventricosus]|uniref:Uncharacterized protein n=1 Tax=Araneus ventricosus TaxID=182803 RepID=A0A4Y2SQ78_ARAVE|nr:hypothetical protein AVEN_171824-1 [Araneus ventricosus]